MKRFLIALAVLICISAKTTQCTELSNEHITYKLRQSADADWLVVGAGASGIAVIGVLLDIGIPHNRIIWLDPEFNVGRMGEYYSHVPANSKAKEFVDFLNACSAFQECSGPEFDYLKQLDINHRGYELGVFIRPLKVITEHLKTKVKCVQDSLASLHFDHDVWHVGTLQGTTLSSNHVILATGSHPKVLPYGQDKVLPLDTVLDPDNLAQLVHDQDIVGIVGSSHSAILLLKYLSEIPVKHIYNFYKYPLQYAVDMGDWTLNKFTGLKGVVAEWAHNVLEKNPPANLTRILSSDLILQTMLKECTKVIYAIGFDQNELPLLNGSIAIETYNEKNGFIAPRLFGIGIAFPELTSDRLGNPGYCISFECFMEYAQKLVPVWTHDELFKQSKWQHARAQLHRLQKITDLFSIYAL